ncbi:MAG: ribosome-binding factor A [Nitrospirae bacterium GWC2_57_13]|nr:MAG: ribosome-binding factor A [Nitrospirae bacterium GWC2_57_13]
MAKPHYKRSVRVSDLMHHEVADILQRKINDPRIGFLTVTEVEISDDLRNAKVFVSLYGGNREETSKGLESAMPFIRAELGRRMQLKFMPEIIFRFDDTAEKGAHIMTLLRGIERETDEGNGDDE